jgi:hypothetical protein
VLVKSGVDAGSDPDSFVEWQWFITSRPNVLSVEELGIMSGSFETRQIEPPFVSRLMPQQVISKQSQSWCEAGARFAVRTMYSPSEKWNRKEIRKNGVMILENIGCPIGSGYNS